MIGLIPKPYLILALVALLIGSNAVTAQRFYRTGHAFAEARHTAEMAKAQAEATLKQKALVGGVQRAAEDAYNEQVALEDRLAAADGAVDRLRQAVAAANQRAGSATATAIDGSTARTLLALCAVEYRDVAKQADKLRATVIGLQGYARAVSQ